MAKNGATLSDIYEVVNRLEDKIDKRLEALQRQVDTNENKIEQNAKDISYMSGKAGGISAAISSGIAIISFLGTYFTHGKS